VSGAMAEPPPKGWYPDPTGAPQWRIWNGTTWSEHVRVFSAPAPPLVSSLEAVRATAVLERGGVVCFFAGFGLLIDATHHHAALTARSPDLYATIVLIGLALAFFGHVAFARAGAAIAPRDRWLAAVPLVNALLWAGWACERASYPLPVTGRPIGRRRGAAEAVRYVQSLSIAALAAYWWYPLPSALALVVLVHLIPVVPACFDVRWARLLREDLAATPVAHGAAR
jgi:hypothetical protein